MPTQKRSHARATARLERRDQLHMFAYGAMHFTGRAGTVEFGTNSAAFLWMATTVPRVERRNALTS